VFVKEFKCTVKGGAIRDYIVRQSNPNDLDMALPERLCNDPSNPVITTSNFKTETNKFVQRLKSLGVKIDDVAGHKWPPGSNGNPSWMLRCDCHFGFGDLELEFVPPYNTTIWPQRSVDATMNNLQMKPDDLARQQVSLIVSIGVSTERIVRQIINKQTSPVYDIRWRAPKAGEKPEGVNNNVFCEGVDHIMSFRLSKMRSKNYKLVEGAQFSDNKVILYHGTSQTAQQAIISSQTFKPGSVGNLGAGVYLSRDMTICKMFGSYYLKCELMPGAVKAMNGWDSSGNWANGGQFQTAFLDQSKSPRTPPLEEWCITPEALNNRLAIISSIAAHP